jgi:YniB-like protein
MDYTTAKRQAATKRIVGSIILAIAVVFLLVGLLLFLYRSLDGGGPALSGLSALLKRLVNGVFEHTQFLLPVWNNAPVPNPNEPTSLGTVGFLVCYGVAFLGAAVIRSGNRLARRLRAIDQQIEDEEIRESMKGKQRRSRSEIEQQVNIPKQPVWKEVHTLYIAPLLVGVVLWLIGKAFA